MRHWRAGRNAAHQDNKKAAGFRGFFLCFIGGAPGAMLGINPSGWNTGIAGRPGPATAAA